MNAFTSLCTPAKIYVILAVTGIISLVLNSVSLVSVLINIIVIPIWTMLLNWICNKGYTVVSWFLLLLPLITLNVIAIAALLALETN